MINQTMLPEIPRQVPAALAIELMALRRLEQDVRVMGLVQSAGIDAAYRQMLEFSLLMIEKAREQK